MNWSDLQLKIRQQPLNDLAKQLLDIQNPVAFRKNPEHYRRLQTHLREKLGLDNSDEIRLIGSGLTGFSLGPENAGAPYSVNSDIEVVIISARLFEQVWTNLLRWRYPWHVRKFPKRMSDWAKEVAENTFAGSIDPMALKYPTISGRKHVPTTQTFVSAWFSAFKSIATIPELAGYDIVGRLYRSKEHLLLYQQFGLERIRSKLPQNME